jgi:hypothetical protein
MALSSTFHRRLLRLSSGRAIIDCMNPLAAIIGTVGLFLLAAGCGGPPSTHVAQLPTAATRSGPSSTTSARPSRQGAALAFSHCMRSHGVPNFPDPGPQGDFPPFHTGVSKQTSAAADDACRHLLSSGDTGTPQQRQQKLAFALNVARCLRAHGFPKFPDPTVSSQGTSENLSGAGIDPNSPQFQAAETACEQQARKALGVP